MTNLRVTQSAVTSPIYRVKGQRSRWYYPDERLPAENCEILRNVDISERGVAHSRFGYGVYNSTQLTGGEAVVGQHEVTFANGDVKELIISPTKIYTDTGTARVNITGSALTGGNDNRTQVEFIKNQAVINNGVDQIQVWGGNDTIPTVAADISNALWSKAEAIMLHKNLLLVLGTTEGGTYNPTRIRWCGINRKTFVVDITEWRADNRYEVYDGGAAIIGGVDNWGQALIFKADGLYPGEIVYDALGLFDFRLSNPIRGFSPIAKHSLVARPEFVCGLAKEGIFVIRPDLSFFIANTDDITAYLELNQNRLKYAVAQVREKDHQVRFLLSSVSNTSGHNNVLVWDWETNDTWIDFPGHTMNTISRYIDASGTERDLYGSLAGFLYEGNNSAYADDAGIGFTWRIKMSPNDLGMPGKSKHILNVRTLYRKRSGQQSITFRAHIDEGREGNVVETVVIGSDLQWNESNSWNTGLKWPGAGAQRADVFVNRICETIAPEWQSSSPSSIEGYIVEFIPLEG